MSEKRVGYRQKMSVSGSFYLIVQESRSGRPWIEIGVIRRAPKKEKLCHRNTFHGMIKELTKRSWKGIPEGQTEEILIA